jgi:hypothetical protein
MAIRPSPNAQTAVVAMGREETEEGVGAAMVAAAAATAGEEEVVMGMVAEEVAVVAAAAAAQGVRLDHPVHLLLLAPARLR